MDFFSKSKVNTTKSFVNLTHFIYFRAFFSPFEHRWSLNKIKSTILKLQYFAALNYSLIFWRNTD